MKGRKGMERYIAPKYILCGDQWRKDSVIIIAEDGTIQGIEPRRELPERVDIEDLPDMAFLPGFVNTHSHVFQRVLRGRTQRPLSLQDSFWTWRRAMYEAAHVLNPEKLYRIAVSTYREMLAAGYTSVGEFHYVHHQASGEPYARENAMAEAVLRAGKDAGIRVVLLMTAYAQGGVNQPPEEGQRRFCDASVERYLARVENLRSAGERVGVAPHSVRAVPESWLRQIYSYSLENDMTLHIHVDEQRTEIEQSLEGYGCRPIEFLERCGALGERTTVIHATHADEREIELLKKRGCSVCICPTTEGDLGDGIAPYQELVRAGIPLSIGADSNTRLAPLEELRWAEYSARMRYEKRRILLKGELESPGQFLLEMGTCNGAKALGLRTGVIESGMAADFVGVNLRMEALEGWNEDNLLDMLFFGTGSEVIGEVWVQGKRLA